MPDEANHTTNATVEIKEPSEHAAVEHFEGVARIAVELVDGRSATFVPSDGWKWT